MKKTFLIIFTFIIFHLFFFPDFTFANIDVTVSPIRYEITLDKWDSTTKTVKLFNNTDTTQEIFVTSKNATWMDENWQPKFVEDIENPAYHLANWITPSTTNFTIGPRENLDIPFTIKVHNKATPGWHYWAIFFNIKENSMWQINIQKRIWVLILLKVPWIVEAEWEVDNITIVVNSYWWWWAWSNNKKSDLIWKIFKKYVLWENIDEEIDLASAWEENTNNNEKTPTDNNKDTDFNVDLTIDFSNKWNTHLKPKWKIEIIDEDWNILKKIWKETIKNEGWAIVWEKVVDYIPINDEDWSVLPNEKRKFNQCWDWFAYETLDENWKKIIKYYDPSEYYSEKNKSDKWYLMPWEKVYTKLTKKKLTAKIKIEYTDPNWKEVDFNSARDFFVHYPEDYIWFNRYIIIPLFIFFILCFLFWIIWLFKKRKCPNCKKRVKKDMKICPYCWEHLKKIKHNKD